MNELNVKFTGLEGSTIFLSCVKDKKVKPRELFDVDKILLSEGEEDLPSLGELSYVCLGVVRKNIELINCTYSLICFSVLSM